MNLKHTVNNVEYIVKGTKLYAIDSNVYNMANPDRQSIINITTFKTKQLAIMFLDDIIHLEDSFKAKM